jgi:polysaccharide biosynthesis protein PelA
MPRAMRFTRLPRIAANADDTLSRVAVVALRFVVATVMLVCVAIAVGSPQPSRALDVEVAGRAVNRTVLAIYDSKQEGPAHQTRLHKLAEMPLNHLGFIVEYRDVNQPLPTVEELARYRAIVTWFVEPLANPLAYVRWLEPATATGLRYVMLGEVAPRESDELIRPINRILAPLGLVHGGTFIDLTYKSKVLTQDPNMIGFEQKLDKALPGFPLMLQRSADLVAHLTIDAATATGRQKAIVVATNSRGGFAAQNFTVTLEPNTDRLSWVINPFAFFAKSLGGERFPVPDVTTVSGRRIYLSHIDGDGWNNLSEVEGYRQTLSSEVVAKELIEPFPDLPVSIGLIAGDVQPLLGGNPAGAAVARRLYALPQVEVASHTHTHPYNWNFFETYNRAEEEKKVKSYRSPTQPLRERLTAALARAAGRTVTDQRYDPYVAGSDDLPRTYLKTPFSLEIEVAGALKISENFAPKGKRAKLYLWSGDTTPFEAAIAATRAAGVRNLNGGDTRLDPEYPSIAYVPAISRPAGRERQIYAVNSNENTYTNDWTGPFNGQALLVNTLRNTDAPRRLKGFNLYYHMYSGEKQASLRAVRALLEFARKSDVLPLDASQYAAIADDYFATEIVQLGQFKWAIKKRGALETVRFDDADHLSIDHSDSTGVLGANRHLGALYVSLDPAVAEPTVTLRARAAAEAEASAAANAQLAPGGVEPLLTFVEGRWRLSGRAQTLTAQGFGPGELTFEGRRNRSFRIKVSRDGQTLNEEIRWTDAQGRLALRYAIDAREPVQLTFACHE